MTRARKLSSRLSLIAALTLAISGCGLLAEPETPSPTPPPTTVVPTEPPPPPTTDPNIFYQDSFTDPASGWPTNAVGASLSGYHPPDAFHLEVAAPNTVFWAFREQDFGDFSAEVVAYVDSLGDGGQWRHGLAFRQAADGQYYAFLINPRAQTWHVLKRAGGVWQALAEGVNAFILADPGANNTLRVDAQGPNFTFSVNGQGVIALGDAEFPVGDFGFVVETLDQPLAHIHFDSIVVRRFDPSQVPPAPPAPPTPAEAGPTPTETTTPVPTAAAVTAQPPPPTLPPAAAAAATTTAAAATAGAAMQTAAAVPTLVPGVPTLPTCGLPGLPACP